MDQLPHLFPRETGTVERYTYTGGGGGSFRLPPRDQVPHGRSLLTQIKSAQQEAEQRVVTHPATEVPLGIVLTFQSDPKVRINKRKFREFKLKLDSLESESNGIEIRNVSVDANGVMRSTVFIPEGKLDYFVSRIEAYADPSKKTAKGKPQNNPLVASISQIRLAAIESFWMDAGEFPSDRNQPLWWEVWLRETTNPYDVVDVFRQRALAVGAMVSQRSLRFPDRRVILVRASATQLLAIENLFDILAELRSAKIFAGEFLELLSRDQVEFIDEALQRIHPPPLNAPAVCHLDTGVNRGHPLLVLALAEEHLLAVDPTWSATDRHPQQHGTGMAGLALYGCLTDLLNTTDTISLQHRLESVKIFPDHGQHDPDLYGDVTAQAVYRIEIVAPERKQRAFALTITTADSRDEGYPTSWSAALDQICSGAEDAGCPSRLMIVSAGNTPDADRHEYPNRNLLHGVEDPAQSWNAVSVGAYTEKTTIHSSEFAGWKPVANAGQLSPASRTSFVWENKSWPIKPDIVMEGGNLAIDPTTGRADYVDDLMLLTTRTSPSGASLTTTGDTSAATALAARYAAIIWSRYPTLSPETVRGLLIHSARWTAPMLAEFPHEQRHNRLRVYGYGVPDLNHALWSAGNNATLIIQDSLQPFDQSVSDKGQKSIKTKDMRLHSLPWPKDVLEEMGGETVRLRVTLSYFVEPSPGRRGWKHKHRYQSHGLRFDIKRPTDTEADFLKRITKSAWDEDEETVTSSTDDRAWTIGSMLRCKGSIHSDVWTGTAAQLAVSGVLAVYPVTGWWKERPSFERWNRTARYSLIISLETDAVQADLYTPIASQVSAPIPVATPIANS